MEITSALGSLKTVKDLVQSLARAHDRRVAERIGMELTEKIIEIRAQLMETQTAHTAVLDRCRQLEEELTRLKRFMSNMENYELKQVGPGAFAYAPKASSKPVEPPHWLCANCYQNAVKSILQMAEQSLRRTTYACPRCAATIRVPNNDEITIATTGPGDPFAGY